MAGDVEQEDLAREDEVRSAGGVEDLRSNVEEEEVVLPSARSPEDWKMLQWRWSFENLRHEISSEAHKIAMRGCEHFADVALPLFSRGGSVRSKLRKRSDRLKSWRLDFTVGGEPGVLQSGCRGVSQGSQSGVNGPCPDSPRDPSVHPFGQDDCTSKTERRCMVD